MRIQVHREARDRGIVHRECEIVRTASSSIRPGGVGRGSRNEESGAVCRRRDVRAFLMHACMFGLPLEVFFRRSYGEAPDGDFTYGEFERQNVTYNER